jgi:hypothetical protein
MKSINETITEVTTEAGAQLPEETQAAIVAALLEREDEYLAAFHMAGAQFGVYPQIVAKVFTDLKFGTPVTDEAKALIDAQFNALMAQFREAYLREHPEAGPQPE